MCFYLRWLIVWGRKHPPSAVLPFAHLFLNNFPRDACLFHLCHVQGSLMREPCTYAE